MNSALRSTTVTSAWTWAFLNVDIAAGLLATTEASPLAEALPANARPIALTLFSLSWKPDACAWPPNASAPAMPRASAEMRVTVVTCIA